MGYLKPFYNDIKHEAPKELSGFLSNCNKIRNEKINAGIKSFSEEEYKSLILQYDSIINDWEEELKKDNISKFMFIPSYEKRINVINKIIMNRILDFYFF